MSGVFKSKGLNPIENWNEGFFKKMDEINKAENQIREHGETPPNMCGVIGDVSLINEAKNNKGQ